MSPKVKICGVRSIESAHFIAKSGADYLGLVFHPTSARHISDLSLAKSIADIAKQYGSIPVAVVVDQLASDIKIICETTGITTIQLHGQRAKQQCHLLEDDFQRIFVIDVDHQGHYVLPDEVQTLNPKKDYLLFDSHKPGSGQVFNHDNFIYHGNFHYFIAGGLDTNNVELCIKKLTPFAVDGNSRLEKNPGVKDHNLVKAFITRVKHA